MELTKTQIEKVESYLNAKGIEYIDIRLEILDHIVSDLENTIETENIDFELSFKKVKVKWNKHLKETSSFYFGIMYAAPKILINKAKKYYRKWFFLSIIIFLIPSFLINKMNVTLSSTFENFINLIFYIITAICFLSFSYMLFKKDSEKEKTTYSFILRTQSWNLLIGFIMVFNQNLLSEGGALNSFNISLFLTFIFSVFSYFHFYKKHKEAIKKYKIS